MVESKDNKKTLSKRDKGGRFVKGHSGNPSGRKRSTFNVLLEQATDDKAELIIETIMKKIEEGDSTIIGKFMSYGLPKGRRTQLPALTGEDPAAAILEAVSTGKITDEEGIRLAKIVEVAQHEQRIKDLENKLEELKK